MGITVDDILAVLSDGTDADAARAVLERIPDEYFETADPSTAARHVDAILSLGPDRPAAVVRDAAEGETTRLTVVARDHDGAFAVVTGAMTGLGFDIRGGNVLTLAEAAPPTASSSRRRGGRRRPKTVSPETWRARRLILDTFDIAPPDHDADDAIAELETRLVRLLGLLEAGETDTAREEVCRAVADRLRVSGRVAPQALMPLELDIDADVDPDRTLITVRGADTFAFLFSLTSGLAMRRLAVDAVRIASEDGAVRDEIFVTEARGGKPDAPERLREIRLAVLLTKQFTHMLPRAPDPYMALSHFDRLLDRVLADASSGESARRLGDPLVLEGLARVLGASEYLWEDFIRLQYESLLPVVAETARETARRPSRDEMHLDLLAALDGADTREARVEAVNAFKDRETFRADLAHIIGREHDFTRLARTLSDIADIVVLETTRAAFDDLASRHGAPLDVGGRRAAWAVFGLGKLGGRELGYASDIELLFVYSDGGETAGPEVVPNARFFEMLVEAARRDIHASRDGIYELDLRLRPHGEAGPLAVSLDSFVGYYGAGGPALDYERLALTRMRAVAGDPRLRRRVLSVRDDILYRSRTVDLASVTELRKKQFEHKGAGERINVKFSAGGLVDLEYAVQMLQTLHGHADERIRAPGTLEALEALCDAGVVAERDRDDLVAAYHTFRSVINGLRMLRGNARDLELPPEDAPEFAHLARRSGYVPAGGMPAPARMAADIAEHMARNRAFFHARFGDGVRLVRGQVNFADIALGVETDPATTEAVLREAGFVRPDRALANMERLRGDGAEREPFVRLAVLVQDMLRENPDPDMALDNLERFAEASRNRLSLYDLLLREPRTLELLLSIAGTSNFLSHVLRRSPEYFDWLLQPDTLRRDRTAEQFRAEWRDLVRPLRKRESVLRMLRRFRRRETLRIGVRDICLREPFETTVRELSDLADTLVDAALDTELAEDDRLRAEDCTVLAFGKHGGRELNYSSDIDLVLIHRAGTGSAADWTRLTERFVRAVGGNTEEGYVYRVDLRLRPFGADGPLATSDEAWARYYAETAAQWEVQALLKARPVAGNIGMGTDLLERVRPALMARSDAAEAAESSRRLRNVMLGEIRSGQAKWRSRRGVEIKNGPGGIRDIEFGVQTLQRVHAPDHPEALSPTTLDAVDALAEAGILDADDARRLRDGYRLLRRVEHLLQIMDDRQLHTLPDDAEELDRVACRLGAPRGSGDDLRERLERTLSFNREFFQRVTGA